MTTHAMSGRHHALRSIQTASQMPRRPLLALLAGGLLGLAVAACGGAAGSPAGPTTAASSVTPIDTPAASTSASTSPGPSQDASQGPDTGGGTATGDVPDNAVYLTYADPTLGFSIQYVEGWQVTTSPSGVVIHDKDSSETVALVAPTSDVSAYISATDLPDLQSQAGFKLVKQDTVKVGSATYQHLVFDLLAPPDPVTGKQVPSTVDRYYVPGTAALAIVSLSTPKGVDNVDAFRQMIQSFAWS
jgi:hypothetical protein